MHTAYRVYPIVSDACIIYAKSATETERERGRKGPERQLPSGHSRWQTHVKCFIRVSLSPRKGGYKFYKFAVQLKKKRRRRVENINARISYLPTTAAAAQDEQGQREGRVETAVAAGSSILRASFARRKTLSSVIQDAVDMFGAYG